MQVPRGRLQAESGLILGHSYRGQIPALLSVACTPAQQLHLVIGGKLPSWGNLRLQHRDPARIYVQNIDEEKAIAVVMDTAQDGDKAFAISEALNAQTVENLDERLRSTPDGKVIVYGIRETMMRFQQSAASSELQQFAHSCAPQIYFTEAKNIDPRLIK